MSAPSRVLHVIDSLDLGGAQTLLLDICKHADRARFEVSIAAMHGNGVFAPAFKQEGITVYSLSPGKWIPAYLWSFPKLLWTLRPDILHFHLFGSNLIAKPIAWLAGWRALVVHDHCNDVGRGNPALLLGDAIANRISSQVIAVSKSVRDFLISREGIDPDRVTILSNGIDTEVFRPATGPQKQEARLRLGIPANAFVIGGVGRLVAQKNFSLFLDVAAAVLAAYPGVLFVIAGTGPLELQLKAKASVLGINGRLYFLGHVADRLALYHSMDALLLTSDFEGTPMTLLEAMACELPVVASAVDGVAEVCTDGRDALLVASHDLGDYVATLGKILEDQSLAGYLGGEARQRVVEKYEIRALVRRIEGIYEGILAEKTAH